MQLALGDRHGWQHGRQSVSVIEHSDDSSVSPLARKLHRSRPVKAREQRTASLGQEGRSSFVVSEPSCHVQRCLASCVACRGNAQALLVRHAFQQRPHDLFVALLRRRMQREVSILVSIVSRRGARLEQRLHDLHVPLLRRRKQRRVPAPTRTVDQRPVRQQLLHLRPTRLRSARAAGTRRGGHAARRERAQTPSQRTAHVVPREPTTLKKPSPAAWASAVPPPLCKRLTEAPFVSSSCAKTHVSYTQRLQGCAESRAESRAEQSETLDRRK